MSNIYNKIILYDDENLMYFSGSLYNAEINQNVETYNTITGEIYTIPLAKTFSGVIEGTETETIQLDETLMKRIAKYNKESEIKKYNQIIEKKKKKIKELDDILQDKEKRIEKLKEFVANIYDLDLEDDEYDEYDEEDDDINY